MPISQELIDLIEGYRRLFIRNDCQREDQIHTNSITKVAS